MGFYHFHLEHVVTFGGEEEERNDFLPSAFSTLPYMCLNAMMVCFKIFLVIKYKNASTVDYLEMISGLIEPKLCSMVEFLILLRSGFFQPLFLCGPADVGM